MKEKLESMSLRCLKCQHLNQIFLGYMRIIFFYKDFHKIYKGVNWFSNSDFLWIMEWIVFWIVISLDNIVNWASKNYFLSIMKRYPFQIVISFENGVNCILNSSDFFLNNEVNCILDFDFLWIMQWIRFFIVIFFG